MNDKPPIKLLVFDIDGVLTKGETSVLDHVLFKCLAGLNRMARENADIPAATICSGRPAPYVELMTQAMGGFLPAIYENGAGLFIPDGYIFKIHPDVMNKPLMQAVRNKLQMGMVDTGFAFFQPGKELTLTLFAEEQKNTDALAAEAERVLGLLNEAVHLVMSPSCLNIVPAGIDKASGVRFLAQEAHIDVEAMLGVGDSDADVPFLSIVGYSAAPANANAWVKSVVQYVSPQTYMDGVRDILAHFNIPCE